MFNLFDRRKQKLIKLASTLQSADDRQLATVFGRGGAEELAIAMRYLPLERLNGLIAAIPQDLVIEALRLAEPDRDVSDKLVARLTRELVAEGETERPLPQDVRIETVDPAAVAAFSTPVCVKALDFAGKVLGTVQDGTQANPPTKNS